MREILFRGKCAETVKWYTGYYINLHKTTYCFKEDYDHFKDNDIHQIVFEKMTDWGLPNQHLRVDVIPETIGQYTGLTDKNGKKIFEGDILKGMNGLYRVYFDISLACFEWAKINGNWTESFSGFADEYEIIGNIYDNPELLKEREG